MKNKLLQISIIAFAMFFGIYVYAQSTGNASIVLKKQSNGLFTLTMKDPQGIKEFSLNPPDKLPYSAQLGNCPTTRESTNVTFNDPADFTPQMTAFIIDCGDNKDEFTISAPKNGTSQGVRVAKEESESTPTPTPTETTIEPATTPAPTASEISFPVPELGNCKDKESCFAYCELPENGKQCLDFAKKHGLLPEEEIRLAEKVLGVKGGPGGCNSKKSCENYCNDISKIDECIAFAEENGLMKGKELEEAKKVRAAVQSGAKMPGGCRNKNECQTYCENPDKMDECLAFAEAAGFLPPEELEQARKFIPLMKSGQTPGGCKSKDQCEAYCESDEHFEECISFAEKNGMIPEKEREHIEAFKKAGGKGPGGCKGRQCQAFCENPQNQEACFNWAKDNGMMKKEDVRRMEEGRKQIEKVFEDAPEEVRGCIEEALGPGGLEKMRSGGFFGGQAVGEKIRVCFESFMSQMGGTFGRPPGEHGEPGGGDFSGPGGCKGPEECMAYCKDNPEECQNFGPPGSGLHGGPNGKEHGGFPGGSQGGFGGPGGCKTPDECRAYCKNNPEACQGFGSQSGGPVIRGEGEHKGEFPPPGEFPGRPGEFPGRGEFPPPQELQGQGGEQFQQQYQQEFQKQYDEQYRQQYEQQYQQQSGGLPPPPTGEFQQYQQPLERSFTQPPPDGSTYTPPPPPPPEARVLSPLGLILAPFANLLR